MAAICPEVFMVALTVAECSRPMSTQVLHDDAVVSMQVATVSANSTAAVFGSGRQRGGDDEQRGHAVPNDAGRATAGAESEAHDDLVGPEAAEELRADGQRQRQRGQHAELRALEAVMLRAGS